MFYMYHKSCSPNGYYSIVLEMYIHAKAELSKHVAFVNKTLMSWDLTACLKFNQVLHICSAQLQLQPTCLSQASTCTLTTQQYERLEWINGFYG